MFKNRAIQVKMVKNEKEESKTDPNEEFIIKCAYANKMAKEIGQGVVKALVSYVVVDTLRQVLVARALQQ